MAHPYLEQLQNLVQDAKIGGTDVICKHIFSGAAAYTHGKIFASLTPIGTAMMLAPHEVHQLLGIIGPKHKSQQMNHRIPAFAVNHATIF